MLKKILLSLCSAFLLFRSIEMLRSFWLAPPGGFSWAEAMILGYLLTLFITGVVALPTFTFPISKLLPVRWYITRDPARLERVYHLLGVDHFKKVLLATLWRSKAQQRKYFDGTRAGLEHFVFRSHQSEFGHFIPFVVITASCIFLLCLGHFRVFGVALFFNIIGNLYPILLQRHHRIRVERILDRSPR